MSRELYDEPGTRTRQSWLRTLLVFLAVSALIAREVIVDRRPVPLLIALTVIDVAVLILVLVRTRELGPHDSPRIRGSALIGAAIAVVAMAAIGLALAL